jgi:membrane protein DedA with SNARE-associated domain
MVSWFEWTEANGYAGVFVMMALESTIVPVPSEIVMPPAGYYAAQGKMSLTGVILAGAAGSTFGSGLTYLITYTLGRAFVERWGRYFLLPPARLALAEAWLQEYALAGVFFARLLPVVRHLIGFPAGLVRVNFPKFAAVTFVGSFVWCAVLAVFGQRTLGANPDLLKDPNALVAVVKHDLVWFVLLVVGLGAGWLFVQWYARRKVKHV